MMRLDTHHQQLFAAVKLQGRSYIEEAKIPWECQEYVHGPGQALSDLASNCVNRTLTLKCWSVD